MKKEKITISITISIACFLLLLIIFMQFKVVYQTDITSIDTMKEDDLKTELANWKEKYNETEQKYKEEYEKLKKYKEESSSDNKTKNNLEEELENAKLMLGITDVEGPGLVITLKNPDNIDEKELEEGNSEQRITASEIMILVNYLKEAGAEAISINNQRIVNKTDFAQIDDKNYIKINSKRVLEPFEIKAIGDAEYLKGTLIGSGFYTKMTKKYGQKVEFEDNKKITINKYDGNLETKYIENEN